MSPQESSHRALSHAAFAETGHDEIEAIRAFNRFYTNRIGVLDRAFMDTPYTLTEARVIYELAAQGTTSASRLTEELSLDPAYLSRMLKSFGDTGLIETTKDPADGRGRLLQLTPRGRDVAADLAERSRQRIAALLEPIAKQQRRDISAAMASVQLLLSGGKSAPAPITIRPHRIGDMGMVIASQAIAYTETYGWNGEYEALVAEICAAFIRNFDPARERCWIAESDGTFLGSIFLVKGGSEGTAKLRLLHVDSAARGQGLGTRLVNECISFAKGAGYRRLELWTNDILVSARRIYVAAGFTLEKEEAHHSFGKDLTGQIWALDLTASTCGNALPA
ncbi:helix-turn-helix domain-containing GNAT family N-acetyltransferase [Pararhizobium sp. YC-54]|uniref:bifunctional helix-turn-helix transcriptional regulator/GNAT family N-acetyltransferase n=1 Tax=Pararhizobium sp. YC-54 TaxID=2986920 RepID=UPI0021F7ACCE|nr:helix-turn-helix domain-containing GNAT family N-acetyltransferase [Pararhizobium sp. YC-54]MCW0001965.1 helix-turn-helix domain-containing GNAT family N-acetyltransferase [Pararhizobium sp. YC-54]